MYGMFNISENYTFATVLTAENAHIHRLHCLYVLNARKV